MQTLGVGQLHKLLAGFDDKTAQSVCTFGYCEGPGKEVLIFQGKTDGRIVEARGPTTFGLWFLDSTPERLAFDLLYRVGRMFRIRGSDVCGNAQGGEEQDFTPSPCSGETYSMVE